EWLAQAIAKLMDVENLSIQTDPQRLRRYDIDAFRCDNRKLHRLTGWRPRVDIMEGLRLTVEWYLENGRRWCWEGVSQDIPPGGALSCGRPGAAARLWPETNRPQSENDRTIPLGIGP